MNGSDGQEVHAMSFRDNGMQAKRRRKPDGGFGVHMRLLLPDSDGGFTMTLLPYFGEVKDQPLCPTHMDDCNTLKGNKP